MNEKLRKLLEKINSTKSQIKSLADEGKIDEAKALKEGTLKDLQEKFDLLKDIVEDEPQAVVAEPQSVVSNQTLNPVASKDPIAKFARDARGGFKTNDSVTPMSEGTNADGGYTVPEDIQTKINHYKEANFSLRQLVSVESVKTNKGARTYQTKAQAAGFGKVLENGAIAGLSTPQFERITYAIEDYAGYIAVTNDLLADSDANIAGEIINWIGKNSLATDNAEILAILQGKTPAELADDLAGIKTAINVTLGQAYRPAVVIVTNDDGLNYLDTLTDQMGRPLLNPNPTEPNKLQLRAGATVVPVEVVPNSVLGSEYVYTASTDTSVTAGKTYYTRSGSGTTESPYVYTPVASPTGNPSTSSYYEVSAVKYPFIIGDLKEAVRIFDREQTTILSSDVASVTGYNAFEQRGRLFRAEIRADYKAIDSDSWVNGYIQFSLAAGE